MGRHKHGGRFRVRLDTADGGERTIRPDPGETFDEIVVDDWLHVERMDTRDWWARVGPYTLNITLKHGAKPKVLVEHDQ